MALRSSLVMVKSLAVAFVLISSLQGQAVQPKDGRVTAVAGESWLRHLRRTFDETSMGKTGRLGPAALATEEKTPRSEMELAPTSATVTLHGSDLYRLNCRGCHGELGQGAPPEINSVINPVRASSAASVMERMKQNGMAISQADAATLAQESRKLLLQRLHNGGHDMPPFPHLSEAEIRSLIAYLKQLADIRRVEKEQVAVQESSLRIGEHVVKSTCHICHSAAGPNPNPEQLLEGAIPPLSTLTARVSRSEFIRKVTRGAPIVMGAPAILCRGRMPVFDYLSEDEAADVYLYLTQYPPYQWATLDAGPVTSQQDRGDVGTSRQADGAVDLAQTVVSASLAAGDKVTLVQPSHDADMEIVALRMVVGLFAALLLALGVAFTVREIRSLSAESKRPALDAGAEDNGAAKASPQVRSALVA